jgi:hypothetical protein
METINVCFKRIKVGQYKGDIIALIQGSKVSEQLTYILFDERLTPRSKEDFKEVKNATVKEYSATKTKLERDFKLNINVVNRLKVAI